MTSKEFINRFGGEFRGGTIHLGGSLYLEGTGITTLPEGLTVGGYLDLEGTGITTLPEGLTLGGSLYLGGTKITSLPKTIKRPGLLSWRDGKYVMFDDMLAEIIHNRGNIWKCKNVGTDKTYYVVTDGTHYAHGATIRQAEADLLFKTTDRNKDQYKGLSLNHSMPLNEAVVCYRVITGACSFGVNNFLSGLAKVNKSYTIKGIIEATRGAYGGDKFAQFFTPQH